MEREGNSAWEEEANLQCGGPSSPMVAPWMFLSPHAGLVCHQHSGAEQRDGVLEESGGGAQLIPLRCHTDGAGAPLQAASICM